MRISFGGLKEREILSQTETGILLEKQIKQGKPITPKLGIELIANSLTPGTNIISGFPISRKELETFKELLNVLRNWTIKGVIILEIDGSLVSERFLLEECARFANFQGKKEMFSQNIRRL